MSYNNYGRNGYNYSPYYQQQDQQQAKTNAQGQPDQTNSNIPYYRSLQDVPAQAPPAAPPQYSSGQTSSGIYGNTYGYQPYGPPNTTIESSGQVSRAGAQTSSTYHDTNARPYMDTTALGSLAYASALGRNGPAVDQSATAQRRDSTNGGLNSPYGPSGHAMSGYSQPKTDSRGSVGASGSNAQSNPVSPYAASIAANALAQAHKSANRESPQLQSNKNHQDTAQNYESLNRASDSQRPAQAYAATAPNSSSTQHQPRPSGNYPGYAGGSYGTGAADTRNLPPPQNTNTHRTSMTPVDQSHQLGQPQNIHAQQPNQVRPAQPVQTVPGRSSSNGANLTYGRPDVQSSTDHQSSARSSVEQHPATVDPSQVFNLQEYQRRKAEAEAEGAKKAAEQRKAQIPSSTTAAVSATNQSGSQAKQPSAEPGSKEQIEAEIKAMIEKMREYKSKDPALFSEVWEQFKKVQPPPRASSQAPQTSKEPQAAQADPVRGSGVASPGFMENGPLPISSPTLDQPSIPSTDNPEQLPDLGKFPLLRRKRKPKEKPGRVGVSFREITAFDVEFSGPASSHASPMQPTAADSQGPAGPRYAAPGEASMRQAMQAFHGAAQPHNLHFAPPSLLEPSQTMPGQTVHHGRPSSISVPHATPYGGDVLGKQSSYTIWPENKKTSLAAVAKEALESYTTNSEKTISADEIRSVLDQNPTYDTLCSVLEAKGFKFERGEFARVLLSAVPEAGERMMGSATTVKKPRRKTGDGSPRRPRGRPRKDGLPPRQHVRIQAPAADSAVATAANIAAPHTPQNTIPIGYSLAGQQEPANAARGDAQDQNLAAALTSAISHIDAGATKQDIGPHPPANDGRPLRWDDTRHLTAESSQNHNQLSSETGHAVYSIAPSIDQPLVNGAHPGIGHLSHAPFMSQLQGQGQTNPSSTLHTHIQQESPASNSVPLPKSGSISIKTPAQQKQSYTPLTKEQMARKRDFSEIVDLTQDSEEELTYHRKRARLFLDLLNSQSVNSTEPAQSSGPGHPQQYGPETLPLLTHPTQSLNPDDPTKSGPVEALPTVDAPVSTERPDVDLANLKAGDAGVIIPRQALRSADVVQELDRRHALKKIKYNPKTIARDVLVTLGLHPTENPLNWHLKGLRSNFDKVTATSDLSTFRWDLVDPGGPELRPTAEDDDADDEAEGIPHWTPAPLPGQIRSGLAEILPPGVTGPRGESVSRDPSRSAPTSDQPTTIPGDQPTFQSRFIHGRPRGRPRGSKAKPRPYLETSDRLVSQAKPSRGSRGARPPGAHLIPLFTHQPLRMNEAVATSSMAYNTQETEPNEASRPSFHAASSTKSDRSTALPSDSTEALLNANSPFLPTNLAIRVPIMTPSPLQSGETSQKRRGRPPGSTNKSSISRSGRQGSPATQDSPRPRGRPLGSKTGTPTRGRPSMRKQTVSYMTTVPPDGVGVILPSRSPSRSSQTLSHVEENIPIKSGKKGRGRPAPRATSPSFQVFNCRWRGCDAKLHNLETLRKHVFKLHGKMVSSGNNDEEGAEAKVPCLWSGCEQDGIFSSRSGPRRFVSENDWKYHVEKKHLEAIAWELGDGPSAHPSDVEPMSYLSDSQGRQITPLARTQGPPDPLPPGSGPSPTRAYHKAHGNVTEHQKTQAELDSRVATKQVAGVFIGRLADTASGNQAEKKSEDEQSESDDDSDNMDTS